MIIHKYLLYCSPPNLWSFSIKTPHLPTQPLIHVHILESACPKKVLLFKESTLLVEVKQTNLYLSHPSTPPSNQNSRSHDFPSTCQCRQQRVLSTPRIPQDLAERFMPGEILILGDRAVSNSCLGTYASRALVHSSVIISDYGLILFLNVCFVAYWIGVISVISFFQRFTRIKSLVQNMLLWELDNPTQEELWDFMYNINDRMNRWWEVERLSTKPVEGIPESYAIDSAVT